MLSIGDKIKVHIFGCDGKEIKTANHNEVFEVREESGTLGIDWNTGNRQTTCEGDVFTPFHTFSNTVTFEDVKDGKRYHFSSFEKEVIENAVLTVKEAYEWIWKNTNLMHDTLWLDFQCLEYCVKKGILKRIDDTHYEVA